MNSHVAIAYYFLTPVEDPQLELKEHQKFFKTQDIKGRIYLSKEGINGQISCSKSSAKAFIDWMAKHPLFSEAQFKSQEIDQHIFDRLTVKVRKQLVAIDLTIDFSLRAEHISPQKWKEMLDNRDENTLVLDVRNDYEGKVGHFEGALIPPLKTFREFPKFLEELKKEKDPKKTKVLMYCTGGIRCEFFSPLLKQAGFENLYQLDGGVINYGIKEGSKHWKGKLFVFDDRLVTPISEDESETISCCIHCTNKTDRYINCANMDCNELFICCEECMEKHRGLCSVECAEGRVRDFDRSDSPKPFRRLPHEQKQKLKCSSCSQEI